MGVGKWSVHWYIKVEFMYNCKVDRRSETDMNEAGVLGFFFFYHKSSGSQEAKKPQQQRVHMSDINYK